MNKKYSQNKLEAKVVDDLHAASVARLRAQVAARAAASLDATQKLVVGGRNVVTSVQRVSRKVPYFG